MMPSRAVPSSQQPQPDPEVLRVSGDHREMGFQQGVALASRIRAAEQVLLASEPFQLLRPRLVPTGIFAAVSRRRAARLLRDLARIRPEQHARLLGIAEGARVSPRTVSLVQAAELLLAAVDWRHAPAPLGACSTAAVRGPRARDGVAVHHNFDYPGFVQPMLFARESRPRRGHAALEMTAAPLPGTVDGVNDAGLAIAYNYALATDAPEAPVPLTAVVSAALERCATTAEAVDLIASHPRSAGALLLVADAQGDVVSLELSPTRSAVRRPAPGVDVISHANRYATPSLREVEVPGDAVFTDRSVVALRGTRVHQSSDVRAAALAAALAARADPLDADGLQAMLADHGGTAGGDDDTLCRHGAYWQTVAMVQLFPRQRRMRIAFDAPCRARPVDLAL